MKKTLISITAAAVFLFCAVSANAMDIAAMPVAVNGENISGEAYTAGSTVMIPVRSTAEALGYTVEWDGENKKITLVNLPQQITFTIGIDGYTFARTAPIKLGQAPEIKEGTAYVPAELFTELLDMDVNISDTVEIISEYGNDDLNLTAVGTITSADGNTLVFESEERGEIVLIPSESTKITNADGDEISIDEISAGDEITVILGAEMTASLPPENNPISIKIN